MKTCVKCGGSLAPRTYAHEAHVGGLRTKDESSMVPTCQECGTKYVPSATLGMLEQRAAMAMLRDRPKAIVGDVVRYARKCLGLRQTELAELLDVRPETISHYETSKTPVSATVALALAGLMERKLRNEPLVSTTVGANAQDVITVGEDLLKAC